MASTLPKTGSVLEVFATFLALGLTSFGGPVAHLGYFREALVVRRGWIDEAAFAELAGLCQVLPGPASSQLGFALGLRRAGLLGGLAAWTGFTLPSALLMLAFACGAFALQGPIGLSVVHGLKLAAVAVVAQAVVGMGRTLTPDAPRVAVALGALALVLAADNALAQVAALGLGALIGLVLPHAAAGTEPAPALGIAVSRRAGVVCLAVFFGLLAGLPLWRAAGGGQGVAVADAFYRSGALVFGGGHVVLPLLRAEVVPTGWIGDGAFLSGYGAAQAMPGPLFSFAAYLGAALKPAPHGVAGAALALVMVFLPGLLILVGVLPFWTALRAKAWVGAGLRGANAAVVGILAAALYRPVWTSAVGGLADVAIVASGFAALTLVKAPAWLVLAAMVGAAVGVRLR